MDNDADFVSFGQGDETPTQEASASPSPPPSTKKETTTTTTDETHPAALSPNDITPKTFRRLLACYPRTVEAVTRHRAIERVLTPKGKKAREERKKAVAAAARAGRPADELTEEQLATVEHAVKAFLELDAWRYKKLGEVASSKGFLDGKEVERLVEWKLKHGVHRPMLMGMIKSNQEKIFQKCTREAFTTISSSPYATGKAPPTAVPRSTDFPKSALNAVITPLRGVGPATASLFLSVVSPTTPFFSDDTYLWVCQGEYPQTVRMNEHKRTEVRARTDNGEIRAKYNLIEYEDLWGRVGGLRARLAGLAEEEGSTGSTGEFSCEQIEKVAFVLRHIGTSGYLKENGLDLVSADKGVKEMDAVLDAGEKKISKRIDDKKDDKKKGGRNDEKDAKPSNGKRKREDESSGQGRNLRPRK